MPARILDGKALAESIRGEIAEGVRQLRDLRGVIPRLEVLLVGESPASQVYVRNKARACELAGMSGNVRRLPADATTATVLEIITQWNDDPSVHGILVQLPLPPQIDADLVIGGIVPTKDVDGFHPENVGLLALGRPRFVPCTPLGVQRILQTAGVTTRGARVVIIGRSAIVGRPMAELLWNKGAGGDATVTVCHSASLNLPELAREAEILIVAMGKPHAVGADWVRPGAAVIDVGIHKGADGKLRGDVDTAAVAAVAGLITPVPGGVGPMTVAMLLENTLLAARNLSSTSQSIL